MHYCIEQCVSLQLFRRTGKTRGNGVVGEWLFKAVGRLGGVWGPLNYL